MTLANRINLLPAKKLALELMSCPLLIRDTLFVILLNKCLNICICVTMPYAHVLVSFPPLNPSLICYPSVFTCSMSFHDYICLCILYCVIVSSQSHYRSHFIVLPGCDPCFFPQFFFLQVCKILWLTTSFINKHKIPRMGT